MLAPQKHGYYVLTDTLHIMHGGSDGATVVPFSWVEQDVAAPEVLYLLHVFSLFK